MHWVLCDATFQAVLDQSRSRCIRLSSDHILEYAATAWDPYHLNNINSLEMVQRRSARFFTGNYNRTPGTVTGILSDLQWPTLQRRRQDARPYLLYRTIQGDIAVSLPSYAATAWDPYHLNNINSLEMVQRRSARFFTGNYNCTPGTVTGILSDLQWPTLQRRRQDARPYLLYRTIFPTSPGITGPRISRPAGRCALTGHSRSADVAQTGSH